MLSKENPQIFHYKKDGVHSDVFDWNDYRIGYFYTINHYEGAPNEDVLFIKEVLGKNLVFGVADGAGGHPKGEEAAFTVGSEVLGNESLAPLDLIEKINNAVIDLKVGAKSTLAFCSIEADMFRCNTVGDSEVVYWNAQGNEIFSTIPHSSVGYKIEAGILNQEDSLDEPDRHTVSHLMGDEVYRVESSSRIAMKKGHTLLVGSDGIFDNISHDSLQNLAGKGSYDKGFEELVSLCTNQSKDWKKNDDIAFILIRKIKS